MDSYDKIAVHALRGTLHPGDDIHGSQRRGSQIPDTVGVLQDGE